VTISMPIKIPVVSTPVKIAGLAGLVCALALAAFALLAAGRHKTEPAAIMPPAAPPVIAHPEPPKPAAPVPAAPRMEPVRKVTPLRLRTTSILGLDVGKAEPRPPDPE